MLAQAPGAAAKHAHTGNPVIEMEVRQVCDIAIDGQLIAAKIVFLVQDNGGTALRLNRRLRRRDEKLNEQLIPWYDTTGKLFLATPDPVQIDREFTLKQEEMDLRYGVRTAEEIRQRR